MIVLILTEEHTYTVAELPAAGAEVGVRVEVVTYETFVRNPQTTLPYATYIFGDLERLSHWQRRIAAYLYRVLRGEGMTVLNDPARARSRSGLLRQLHRVGINRFNAYRVEEAVKPAAWPVFLRCEGDHHGPLTELLHDWEAVEAALNRLVLDGVPLANLMIVEFAAQPVQPGLYRKLAMFRVGGHSIAHCCVHDDHWVTKHGKKGIASPELYADELRIVRDNPFRSAIDKAFDIAGLDFGRADFGIVDGLPQVYEINDNPTIHFLRDHPSPYRLESYRLFRQNFLAALGAIDTAPQRKAVAVRSR
jgi:hypothetical protein